MNQPRDLKNAPGSDQRPRLAPAGEVPRGARRGARLRPVRPYQHRGARRAGEKLDQVRQHAPRAGRRAHGRRLCARETADRGGAQPPRARAHQRRDRRGECGARFDPDGGDRRRRAEPLLRQASAPGSQPACRCLPIRDLPAVREARVARRAPGSLPRDHRQGLPARRERPPRSGAGVGADGHFLQAGRSGAVPAPGAPHPGAAQALDRRPDRRAHGGSAGRRVASGDLCRRRRAARRRRRRAAGTGRAFLDSGRAQPDGQGRAARRPSPDAGHDRVLGHRIHQPQVPRGGLRARPRARALPRRTAAPGTRASPSRFRRRG